MSNISFGNVNPTMQSISPEMQKRIESGENFGAIDTQKIKEDTVEITQNAVKENFIFKIMRNVFGVKDPKKTLTSIGLTAVTVVAFATLGNKSIKKMSQMGLDVDKFLQNRKDFELTNIDFGDINVYNDNKNYTFYPNLTKTEGFFVARLKKK